MRHLVAASLLFLAGCAAQGIPLEDGTGGGGSGGGGNQCGPSSAQCQACELSSSNGDCDPGFLSQDGSGHPFGCSSLPLVAQVAACQELLTCIASHGCSSNSLGTAPGDNPAEGCYCGPAPETTSSCLTGSGVVGACVAQYHAAAIADNVPGLTASSSEGTFAGYIGVAAYDPTSALGMADNVVACAVDAPCSVCVCTGGF